MRTREGTQGCLCSWPLHFCASRLLHSGSSTSLGVRQGKLREVGWYQSKGWWRWPTPKLVMYRRGLSRAYWVKGVQKRQLSYSITAIMTVYSIQIRFQLWFPHNLPCHQVFGALQIYCYFSSALMLGVPVTHFCGWLHLSFLHMPNTAPYTHTHTHTHIHTHLDLQKYWTAASKLFPTALHGAEKWLTAPESILQKTLNLGVRDSNPDCCSQVYPETGRKAIYLLDLKLAPRSHQWDPVRFLYRDSAFKNCFIHWANISSSYAQSLSANGSMIEKGPQCEEICSWHGKGIREICRKKKKVI